MTPERFQQIISAYGAASHRWPADERAAAEAFTLDDADAQAALAREAGLDRMLGAYRIAPASSALIGAVIASARPRRRLSWILQGLGVAGAGLAGALAGAFLMTVYAPSTPGFVNDEGDQPVLTSFDVIDSDYDLDENP